MNKKLIEDFSQKYGWSDEAILNISGDDIDNMSLSDIDIYCNRMENLNPDGAVEFKHLNQDLEGNIILRSEED